MKVKELKETINDLDDNMDVNVPSCLDGDYTESANATVCQYANGEKYLLIHE